VYAKEYLIGPASFFDFFLIPFAPFSILWGLCDLCG